MDRFGDSSAFPENLNRLDASGKILWGTDTASENLDV
jgi:hypothetical protein